MEGDVIDPRLVRLLGGQERAPLRRRLRRHFERGRDSRNADGTGRVLHLANLSAFEHATLADVIGGAARPAGSIRLDLAEVDSRLRIAGIADSLRDALEMLDGPVINHAALRATSEAAWATACKPEGRDPRLAAWLQAAPSLTLLKRQTKGDALVAQVFITQADTVLRRLPANGITRAQLAAQTLGDAHALDAGQPVAAIVLSALGATRPGDKRPRDIWARAGVLVNELARPALILNLPMIADATWRPGEPAYLSLRQLLRTAPMWQVARRDIFVCENPNLLAIAADHLGASCAPLVCTDGMPAAAQRTLLTQLAEAGARLHYHGDFDWDGLRIANHVLRTWRARPWRIGVDDYTTAVQNAPHAQRNLGDAKVDAVWDDALAQAMHHHGFAIAEEAVADSLLRDLGDGL